MKIKKYGKIDSIAIVNRKGKKISDLIAVKDMILGQVVFHKNPIKATSDMLVRIVTHDDQGRRVTFFLKNAAEDKNQMSKLKSAVSFDEALTVINKDKPCIKVKHSQLERSDESRYRSICPTCKKGLLLVSRHNDTYELEEFDRCVLCAQQFQYLDIKVMRKAEKSGAYGTYC